MRVNSAASAANKAFLVNRIGDFAFLVGLFALVARFGTLNYGEIFGAVAADPHAVEEVIDFMTLNGCGKRRLEGTRGER